MALFSDGGISTISDLRAHETGILEAANSEGIDLGAKLALADQEIGAQLTRFLRRQGEQRAEAGNVAVSAVLRQWHALHTLALTYRDLYYNQLNDRYRAKWTEYSRLAREASSLLFETGTGIVDSPIRKADAPEPGSTAGPLAAATCFARVAWVDARGQEGSPSDAVAWSGAEGSKLTVRAVNAPEGAAGWNVYVGESDDAVQLQNDSPLAAGQVWEEPDTGLRSGRRPGEGQTPDRTVTLSRVLQRG